MEYTKRNIIETQRNRYASLGTALLLIALALVSCSSLTQPASKAITFDYEVDWETIGDRRILFKTDIDGDFDLYVADGYADQLRRITNDPYHNKYADPSPDGTQVVYSSNRDGGDFDLFVVNIDGTQVQQLTHNDAEDYSPTWSPSGQHIAYEANGNPGAFFQIHIIDADGSNKRQITSDPYHNYAPDWSPDGRMVSIFSNQNQDFDIYTIDIVAGKRRLIADDNSYAHFPDFSPDGRTIVYQSNPEGNWNIYRVPAAGAKAPTRITFSSANDIEPDWSRDSTELLFASDRNNDLDIYIMGADGNNPQRLISTRGRDTQPMWIPDPP